MPISRGPGNTSKGAPPASVPGTRTAEGTGLGLPLTKALVEANHAGFSIKSRKDQGTLVEIAFPVRRAAQ